MSKIFEELTQEAVNTPKFPCREFINAKLGLITLDDEKQKLFDELNSVYRREAGIFDCQIALCKGTGCHSSGEATLYDKIEEVLRAKDIRDKVNIVRTGCRGFCEMGPLMEIFPQNVFYCKVKPEDVEEIINKTVMNGEIIEELLFDGIPVVEDIPFYQKQVRRVLKESGHINPENINDSIAHDSYQGFIKASKMSPEEVIQVIKDSGLRGRGGGGFPTGLKLQFTRAAEGDKKYIICNADEGDPGAFMDRSLLEGDPHRIIEGMMIAGYVVGSDEGYIYVRAEYPLAIHRLKIAIEQCREFGLLGKNILGTGFDFNLKIKEGAGAFVCGEETALISSIEGKRGMPTVKPPFPATSGLYGKPTAINNVETLANVSLIMNRGVEWFKEVGTANSAGTKVFAMTGKIRNTGLVEVPMGITLREIVFEIGGGIKDGAKFKAAQIGGPSGGCLTEEHLDMPLDYDSLQAAGAMVGSGGLVILDDKTCMVETARYFMSFTQKESCGKCTFCRIGTRRMLEILEKIISGKGEESDIAILESLSDKIKTASLCGLGQTAPNPVLTTLRYFREEYLAHIVEKRCPAKVCTELLTFHINSDVCIGCTACSRVCPVNCITGEVRKPHIIDQTLCIKCGSCYNACKFSAIEVK